jgi:hypothetical protein
MKPEYITREEFNRNKNISFWMVASIAALLYLGICYLAYDTHFKLSQKLDKPQIEKCNPIKEFTVKAYWTTGFGIDSTGISKGAKYMCSGDCDIDNLDSIGTFWIKTHHKCTCFIEQVCTTSEGK